MRGTASVTPALGEQKAFALRRVRRDIVVLSVLIGAVALLIFNGSNLFQAAMSGAADQFRPEIKVCLLYTSPSPRDGLLSRMPSSA